MEVALLLLQYLIIPLLCAWIIVILCNKSAKEIEKEQQRQVDNT